MRVVLLPFLDTGQGKEDEAAARAERSRSTPQKALEWTTLHIKTLTVIERRHHRKERGEATAGSYPLHGE
jgi:hypothetical protein